LVGVHNQIEVSLKRDGRTDFDGSDVTILTISLFLSHLAAQLSHHFSPSTAGVFTTDLELGLLMSSVDERVGLSWPVASIGMVPQASPLLARAVYS